MWALFPVTSFLQQGERVHVGLREPRVSFKRDLLFMQLWVPLCKDTLPLLPPDHVSAWPLSPGEPLEALDSTLVGTRCAVCLPLIALGRAVLLGNGSGSLSQSALGLA